MGVSKRIALKLLDRCAKTRAWYAVRGGGAPGPIPHREGRQRPGAMPGAAWPAALADTRSVGACIFNKATQ